MTTEQKPKVMRWTQDDIEKYKRKYSYLKVGGNKTTPRCITGALDRWKTDPDMAYHSRTCLTGSKDEIKSFLQTTENPFTKEDLDKFLADCYTNENVRQGEMRDRFENEMKHAKEYKENIKLEKEKRIKNTASIIGSDEFPKQLSAEMNKKEAILPIPAKKRVAKPTSEEETTETKPSAVKKTETKKTKTDTKKKATSDKSEKTKKGGKNKKASVPAKKKTAPKKKKEIEADDEEEENEETEESVEIKSKPKTTKVNAK